MSRFAAYGVLTSHSYEVQQILDVSLWASKTFGQKIVLVGSSAGAPFAGSAMSNLLDMKEMSQVDMDLRAYIGVGYTFGRFASLAFGGHFSSVMGSNRNSKAKGGSGCEQLPPRLFVMGENDEFTSVQQLTERANEMRKMARQTYLLFRGLATFSSNHRDMILSWQTLSSTGLGSSIERFFTTALSHYEMRPIELPLLRVTSVASTAKI